MDLCLNVFVDANVLSSGSLNGVMKTSDAASSNSTVISFSHGGRDPSTIEDSIVRRYQHLANGQANPILTAPTARKKEVQPGTQNARIGPPTEGSSLKQALSK